MNFINDSFRSTLCLRYSALEIGTAMLFLATIQQGIKPTSPSTHRMQNAEVTWLELLTKDVEEEAIRGKLITLPHGTFATYALRLYICDILIAIFACRLSVVICMEMVDFYRNNADMVWMSDTKQLSTLKKSTYDTLGVPESDSNDQESADFPNGIQGSPSTSSLDNDYHVDTYEQMLERDDESVGVHKVTVSRVHAVTKIEVFDSTTIRHTESQEDDAPPY
ncbi:hypothetical protein EON65_34410, partial [archaeon]